LEEAGTTQPCPDCNIHFVVPGKAERDQLRAKQETERQAKADAKQREQSERLKQKMIAEEQRRQELAAIEAKESQVRAYQASHCPYCWEQIKPGVKKCKHCHEYLDPQLLAGRHVQDVIGFKPPLNDVVWLVIKFWVASAILFVVGWILVIFLLALLAAMGIGVRGVS
jgi:hypothetical protein